MKHIHLFQKNLMHVQKQFQYRGWTCKQKLRHYACCRRFVSSVNKPIESYGVAVRMFLFQSQLVRHQWRRTWDVRLPWQLQQSTSFSKCFTPMVSLILDQWTHYVSILSCTMTLNIQNLFLIFLPLRLLPFFNFAQILFPSLLLIHCLSFATPIVYATSNMLCRAHPCVFQRVLQPVRA